MLPTGNHRYDLVTRWMADTRVGAETSKHLNMLCQRRDSTIEGAMLYAFRWFCVTSLRDCVLGGGPAFEGSHFQRLPMSTTSEVAQSIDTTKLK